MNQEEIIRMAFELGTAVADSELMQDYRATQSEVIKDAEAYNLVMRFQEAREQASHRVKEGGNLTEEEQNHLQALEVSLRENSLVSELMGAQEKVSNLMNAVYFAIEQAINGPDCGGGSCDSCGGSCC